MGRERNREGREGKGSEGKERYIVGWGGGRKIGHLLKIRLNRSE